MLERELRVAGVGVVDQQPLLVMAGHARLTFNADLVALDTGDIGSVYINPDADSASVDVLRHGAAHHAARHDVVLSETTYMASPGVPSNAETISYWLSRGFQSSCTNEYILWRRVNARPPRMVARGIVYNPAIRIFRYFKSGLARDADARSLRRDLPIVHTATIHGTQADTGNSAMTDSVQQVRVQFTSIFHDPKSTTPRTRQLQATIKLMNAGLIHHATCGQPPIAPTAVTASLTVGTGRRFRRPT